ncbi:hypothetical protein ACFX4Y_25045 [Priestia sp. YIM B13446]|uniref:hypothetical protein n=1 Tax=unclassified Priestia TaxID=2800374 RepID=UPI00367003C2
MLTFIAGLSLVWGIIIFYSSLFKMKKNDYKSESPIGVSGYIELEVLIKLWNRFPMRIAKTLTILTGCSFITFGTLALYAIYKVS